MSARPIGPPAAPATAPRDEPPRGGRLAHAAVPARSCSRPCLPSSRLARDRVGPARGGSAARAWSGRATASRCPGRCRARGPRREPARRARVPTGASAPRALAAGEYAAGRRRARASCSRPRRATVAVDSGEARLDLVLWPRAPVREHVVVTRHARRGRRSRRSGVSVTSSTARRSRSARPPSFLHLAAGACRAWPRRAPAGSGSQGSVFVRGGESRYARILVDGVPVNQPGGAFDFGSALPLELRAGRGRARRGQQPLRHRRPRGRRPARHAARRRRRGARAARRGRGRVASPGSARLGATSGRARGLRLERRPRCASTTDNEEPNSALRARRRRRSLAGATLGDAHARCAPSCASRTARSARRGRPPSAGPTSTPPSSARTWCSRRALRRVRPQRRPTQLRVGFATTDQLSRNPRTPAATRRQSGRPAGALPDLRLPEPGRLPERDRRASRRATRPDRPLGRGTC